MMQIGVGKVEFLWLHKDAVSSTFCSYQIQDFSPMQILHISVKCLIVSDTHFLSQCFDVYLKRGRFAHQTNQLFQREYLGILYRKDRGYIYLDNRMNGLLQSKSIPLRIFKIKGIIPKADVLIPKSIRFDAFE